MSNSILDQAEIDALLNAAQVDDELMTGADLEASLAVRSYVFQTPDLISRTQFRGLFALHESFARDLQSSLSLLLRTRVELHLVSVDQQRFVDFATSLDQLTNIHMFEANPLAGMALVDFSMPVIYGILDHQLGGNGTGTLPKRPLTAVETAIIEPVLRMFFRGLQEALSTQFPIEIQRLRTEANAEYAQITTPEAPVVAACIDVEIGSVNGMINICYPAPMVAEVVGDQQGRTDAAEEEVEDPGQMANRKLLLASLMDVPINVPVVLSQVEMSTADWLDIQPGDILVLPQRVHQPVLVKAEGLPLYHARPGRTGNLRSVRLLRPAAEDRADDVTHLLR